MPKILTTPNWQDANSSVRSKGPCAAAVLQRGQQDSRESRVGRLQDAAAFHQSD